MNAFSVETLTRPILGRLHHAHCSSIVAFPDGELFVVFYWAKKEAEHTQAIYGMRKLPGDTEWSFPFVVSKDTWQMEGNPVLWIAPDTGKLFLFYVKALGGWSTCIIHIKTSEDRGITWSKARKIHPTICRVTKNPPILTKNGSYVLPATIEFRDCLNTFFISKDQGVTWTEHGRILVDPPYIPKEKKWGRLVDQPTLIERKDGTLWALMRAYGPLGTMMQTESQNGGITWTPAKPYILPNPDGGFLMQRLQNGDVGILYNHSPAPPTNQYQRNPLSFAISQDDGKSWKFRRNLCEDQRKATPEGFRPSTFEYPTYTQDSKGKIHATWSYRRTTLQNHQWITTMDIQYTTFDLNEITSHSYFDQMWEI